MNELKWFVIKAMVNDQGELKEVVRAVKWGCSISNGQWYLSETGTVDMDDPVPEQFIEFENLTQANILAWLDGKIDKPAIEARLTKKFDDEFSPSFAVKQIPA